MQGTYHQLVSKPGKEASRETNSDILRSWTSRPPELRGISFCCPCYAVRGALLWQPEQPSATSVQNPARHHSRPALHSPCRDLTFLPLPSTLRPGSLPAPSRMCWGLTSRLAQAVLPAFFSKPVCPPTLSLTGIAPEAACSRRPCVTLLSAASAHIHL